MNKAEGSYSVEEMQVAASKAATQEGITNIEGNNHKIGVLLGCPDMLLFACEQLKAADNSTPKFDGYMNAAMLLLDRVIDELEIGFVACQQCGDQEDTKNLDCMSDLKDIKKYLDLFIQRQQKTN